MKKIMKYAAFAIGVMVMASCGKQKFHVEGEITDAKDQMLYFENMSLDGPVAVDSVKLDENGSFSFTGEPSDAPEFYRLRIEGQIINVSIDSTETVNVKASYPVMSSQYEVSGSENCQKIKELAVLQQQLYLEALAIDNNTSLGVEQAQDSIEKVVAVYKDNVLHNYIMKAPGAAYAYFALFQTLGGRLIFNPRASVDDIRVFGAVATSWDMYYPESERGQNLHNIAIEGQKTLRALDTRRHTGLDLSKVEVSNIIDVPLIDNKGKRRSLKDLAGKVVLLDFHAFSMEGSTERIMLLRDIYNKYHAQGLEIYQVSVDPNEHFWKTQTAALPWINVFDPDGIESQYLLRYNVAEIPTFFLIDRSNSLYKRDAQIKDIDAEIKSLL